MIFIYNAYILFFIATLPVILIGLFVYLKDVNKEPKKIIIRMFLGGIISAIITVVLTQIYRNGQTVFIFDPNSDNNSMITMIIHTFIEVALIEELSKWVVTYFFSYNDKEFDELYDMIVYAVFVSLGFAWIENVLYIFENGRIEIAIIRLFVSVPIHASLGIFMGYFLSLSKLNKIYNSEKHYKKNLSISLLVPILLHGIYDFCLYTQERYVLSLLLIFIVFIHITAYKKIKLLSEVKLSLKQDTLE